MKFRAALFAFLFLAASAFAQNVPNSQLWGAGWNDIAVNTQPSPWCPKDSAGNVATLTSFRMWDDGVKWGQVESCSGTCSSGTSPNISYDWTKLDWAMSANIATHAGCNMRMLYQFGDTPQFVAAGVPSNTCSDPNTAGCAPPSDVNGAGGGADSYWLNFVGQIALRYSGKSGSLGQMAYWGTRNEADSSNFWCWSGTVCGNGANPASAPNVASLNNLVLMAWDMKQLTRCIDSTSRVVSPDGHVNSMLAWFHNFTITSISAPSRTITITPPAGATYAPITCSWSAQTVTGAMTYDIVDEHMRGTSSTNTDPTAVITAYNNAVTEMTQDGLLAYPLWNDEWGWNHTSTGCQVPNTATGAGYIAESLALMASFSTPNISQENIYLWDNMCIAPPSQTIIGLANDVVAGWLTGSTVQNFTNSGSVYSIPGTFGGGGSFRIMFDKSQTCSGSTISTCNTSPQSAGSFTSYTDIGGTVHAVGGGGTVPVGFAPIILTGSGGGTTAATPTFSPNGGTFSVSQSVTISSTSVGAIKCYTTNGTTPATNGTTGCTTGTLYSGPVSVGVNETLKAVAGGTGFTDSSVASAAFVFKGSAPTFSPPGATYSGSQTVSLSNTQSLPMCYTTDGSTPTSNGSGSCSHGTLYTVAIVVAASETIKAIGMQSGWTDSSVGSATYVINYTLSVSVSGLGSVSSSPIGINACSSTGGTCSDLFPQGTSITLTATPGSGYSFAGWSGGGCSGTGGCTLTLNSSTSVTATFSVIIPAITVGQPAAIIM